MGSDYFDFEFPTPVCGAGASPAVPNDIVFCGKVISRQAQPRGKNRNPFLLRSESSGKLNSGRSNGTFDSVRSTSTGENRWRRRGSSRKHYNTGLFGMLKFPLQMELSDIKTRQDRREPMPLPLPKLAAEGDGGSVSARGGEICWDPVRPLRRRTKAKATFGCFPLV